MLFLGLNECDGKFYMRQALHKESFTNIFLAEWILKFLENIALFSLLNIGFKWIEITKLPKFHYEHPVIVKELLAHVCIFDREQSS